MTEISLTAHPSVIADLKRLRQTDPAAYAIAAGVKLEIELGNTGFPIDRPRTKRGSDPLSEQGCRYVPFGAAADLREPYIFVIRPTPGVVWDGVGRQRWQVLSVGERANRIAYARAQNRLAQSPDISKLRATIGRAQAPPASRAAPPPSPEPLAKRRPPRSRGFER